ncbi:hypothetical protein JCM19301_2740 [Jejuia pallidilutea]|uniref:Rhodanese domain-containing protein n=1 Tax=Jejuia pallidilutea TaxID=504487 RepID=A0A090VTS7_9FLAO|nr:hypothetical protein JCM19301_2740 [Jejuia pallidilutea]
MWWLFKAFGFSNIAVLDGGFPEWKKAGFPIENAAPYNDNKGSFKHRFSQIT